MPDETPHESADLEDYEVADSTDTLSGAPGDDPLDRGVVPPERWTGAIRHGDGEDRESLDELLAEEEPDVGFGEDDEDEDDEDALDDEDAGDEDVDGLLLDDGPDRKSVV